MGMYWYCKKFGHRNLRFLGPGPNPDGAYFDSGSGLERFIEVVTTMDYKLEILFGKSREIKVVDLAMRENCLRRVVEMAGKKCAMNYADGRDLLIVIDAPINISDLQMLALMNKVEKGNFKRISIIHLLSKAIIEYNQYGFITTPSTQSLKAKNMPNNRMHPRP